MANFEPTWVLKADDNLIQEGQSTYVRLSINREADADESYIINNDQYIEISMTITSTGTTYENRDFELLVGESVSDLIDIKLANSGNINIAGEHTFKLNKKDFELGTNLTLDAYLLKLNCLIDGTWDGPESLSFTVNSVTVITLTDNEISDSEPSGLIGTNTVSIAYDTTNEIWVTPGLTTRDDEMFAIGGIGFGSNSTLFVQAYGQTRDYDSIIDISEDVSNRVYYPVYQIVPITTAEIPSTNRTGSGTILNTSTVFPPQTEESDIIITDPLGNSISTGLKFNSNGQFLNTMLYESDPIDAYVKVKIVDLKSYYVNETDAFYIGKKFKAYSMWICPNDTSTIYGSPTPGHLYQLKNNDVYPYTVKSEFDDGETKALFKPSDWIDLGFYDETLGDGIIGNERIFRIIFNSSTGNGIDFLTDSNLGEIHVGEYFGHTVYPRIEASGIFVTYTVDYDNSTDDIRKYNIDLSADGYMIGTAYAKSSDFTINDEIELEFNVVANDITGLSVTKEFNIRIIRGMNENYISSYICPSLVFERDWFKTISTNTFSNQSYYRGSDSRYGLHKVPRMLLKENFVNPSYNFTTLNALKKTLRDGIVNTSTGSPVPTGEFKLVLGNYKIVSALDSLGNIVYDLLFREVHPSGVSVSVSLEPRIYTMGENALFSEIFGLRQNIFIQVGEDSVNLLTDPTDYQNRGLVVEAISGISEEMIDTVPRFMNHPYAEDGLTAKFMPIIPVAYFKPGQAEAFFNKLIQNGEHSSMINTEFEINSVQFGYFSKGSTHYVPSEFNIQIKSNNLI